MSERAEEDRLTELELRFMEQQAFLQSLSDVVAGQQRELDQLRAAIEGLRQRVRAELGLVDANEVERPPHY